MAIRQTDVRPTREMFVQDLSEETVLAATQQENKYGRKMGKGAKLYRDVCGRCNKTFEVLAYTVLNQYRKNKHKPGWQLRPPDWCSDCFSVARTVATPRPPANARLENLPEQVTAEEAGDILQASIEALAIANHERQHAEAAVESFQEIDFEAFNEQVDADINAQMAQVIPTPFGPGAFVGRTPVDMVPPAKPLRRVTLITPGNPGVLKSPLVEKALEEAGHKTVVVPEPPKAPAPPKSIPAVQLLLNRKMFEGKAIDVWFKKKVSFSDTDESDCPESNVTCLAYGPVSITVLSEDEPIHAARTYAHADVESIALAPAK